MNPGTVDDTIRCDACPVLCRIRPGKVGACDRYANQEGSLIRLDPLLFLDRFPVKLQELGVMPSRAACEESPVVSERPFLTGIGATTTYPDYKPAPFIVSSKFEGVDVVTVVTEGIFSYCGVKIKVDTDRFLGPECSTVRVGGEPVGHVTSAEYGSQMLSLGGVRHLTGGGKREGVVTCETLLSLANKQAVELSIDGGETLTVQAGRPPVFHGEVDRVMRVGCGSATIGIFAPQWQGLVDEVIVVDDHITGVLSEHQAGRFLDWRETGLRVSGRRSTPGRYFQVALPGSGWGGTQIDDPLVLLDNDSLRRAWPGLRLLFVSTTGEHAAYYEFGSDLRPIAKPVPATLQKVNDRIAENCEPAHCTVMFVGGAGGSLRAGVTGNPIALTRSVHSRFTHLTCGGVPTFVYPGGGITFMVDVSAMPDQSFGYVPTPALVAPIEFTMKLEHYLELGGPLDRIRRIDDVIADSASHQRWEAR